MHRSGPVFGLARSCRKLLLPNRRICKNSGHLVGAGIYTCTPVEPQKPPARPSQAENRPGPVYMYIPRSCKNPTIPSTNLCCPEPGGCSFFWHVPEKSRRPAPVGMRREEEGGSVPGG